MHSTNTINEERHLRFTSNWMNTFKVHGAHYCCWLSMNCHLSFHVLLSFHSPIKYDTVSPHRSCMYIMIVRQEDQYSLVLKAQAKKTSIWVLPLFRISIFGDAGGHDISVIFTCKASHIALVKYYFFKPIKSTEDEHSDFFLFNSYSWMHRIWKVSE